MSGAPTTQRLWDRGAYKWYVIGMLWFVCFFNYADRQAIFSVFPLLKTELSLSDVQLGVVAACFMWVYAIFGPVTGWLGDRLSRKGLILGGLAFWSAVTGATALSHGYRELILWRALGGLGEAFYFPAAMSMISDYHSSRTRSRAMSIHQSSVYAGTIVGGTLSGFIAERFGWRSSFALLGVLGVFLAVAMLALLREPVRGQSQTEDEGGESTAPAKSTTPLAASILDVLRNPIALLLMMVFIGANFVAMIFLTWMPSFLYTKFHLSLFMAGLNATVYLQLASVAGVLSGGILADRLARKHKGGRMLAQALGLLCGVPALLLTGWTASLPTLLVAMTAFGYFKGIYDANIFASLHDVVPVERRAVAAGLMNSLGWLGGGIAPVAVAYGARHFGMGACISVTAAVYLSIGTLLTVGVWRLNRSAANRTAI